MGVGEPDAGAQAQRRAGTDRPQQDRARRRPRCPGPRRRRPDARRHPHDLRPARRGHHDGARRAEHPHRGRARQHRAELQPARRPFAGHLRPEGGHQPGHLLVLPVDRRRPPRRADRRRHRRAGQPELTQAQRGRRDRPGLAVRVLRPAHRLRPLPAARPRRPPGHRDPAVLLSPRRLRPGHHGRGGDRAVPADLLARLPAGHPDAVQQRHHPPADVQLLPADRAQRTRWRTSTTATRTSPGCRSSPAASAWRSTGCAAAAR